MSLRLSDYLDLEAEEGSDNEEHDNVVKRTEDVDENEEEKDVEGLIDDSIKNTLSDLTKLRDKYNLEEIAEDKKSINNIIDGNFKRKKRKYQDLQDSQEDKDTIAIRKKLVGSSQEQGEKFDKNKILVNFSKYKKMVESDSNENEHLNEMIENYENDIKKKITENSSTFKRNFKERIQETNRILENVIDLNKEVKHPLTQSSIQNRNPFLAYSQNSILKAIKTDKYYTQSPTKNQKTNICPMFIKNPNSKFDSEKKKSISAIFSGQLHEKVKVKK
jgi:hypothetical protein